VVALHDVDLGVPRNSVTGIIGRSGAGKSTLLRLVNGLEKPTRGRVLVDGADVAPLAEARLRDVRRSIGMIFQHFNLLSSRTVFDNVALPLEIAGISRRDIETRVTPLLDLVGLADKRDRFPSELSGGQKQRVGIARALSTRPKLLLSDEATSALDPETTLSVLDLLRQINRELGLTILLITHEMEVVKGIAEHVAVIDSGRIVERGSAFEIFAAPRHVTTQALLAGLPGRKLPARLQDGLKDSATAGSRLVLRVTQASRSDAEPLLQALIRAHGSDLEIVNGTADEIGGRRFESFVITLPGETGAGQPPSRDGIRWEVLGHVD
jgi:D-methionine transport system ATP-binding protein